jgi:hypothetical protein
MVNWEDVLFKHDQMYKHNLMHINHTTYNVCRDQDVVRVGARGSSDVMVLAAEREDLGSSSPSEQHPFKYARVLGIYHVNVIYIGEKNADYSPRRLEFLWVWWWELEDYNSGWSP